MSNDATGEATMHLRLNFDGRPALINSFWNVVGLALRKRCPVMREIFIAAYEAAHKGQSSRSIPIECPSSCNKPLGEIYVVPKGRPPLFARERKLYPQARVEINMDIEDGSPFSLNRLPETLEEMFCPNKSKFWAAVCEAYITENDLDGPIEVKDPSGRKVGHASLRIPEKAPQNA